MLETIKLPFIVVGSLLGFLIEDSHRFLLLAFFAIFLALISYTLYRSHRYIFSQRQIQQKISAMNELSRKMITCLDEEKIIRSTLETAKKILDFEFCDFLLFDKKKNELFVRDSIGEMASIKGYRIPIDEGKGISAAVAMSGKAIHLSDVSKDARYIPVRFKEGSEVCVPVIIKDNVIGVINAEKKDRNAFSTVDELLFSELAAQAAIAIENARLNKAIVESEKKYRTVIDNVNIGVSLISPQMEILFLNNQMKKWFPHINVSDRPICYKAFYTPPKEEVCSYCPTCKTLQDGLIHESITEIPVSDRTINFGVTSFPIKDENGKIIAAIELVDDFTERERHERMIIHAKKDWENTFDSVPDLIVIVDSDHKIMRLNKAMAARLGLEPKDAIGKLCYSLVHGSEMPPSSCLLCEFESRKRSRCAEFHLDALDGDFLLTVSPLMEESGKVIGAVHVFRDITERKKMEEALMESEEKYRAAVEESQTGVYIIQDGVFKFVNKSICERFGYAYDEIIDKLSPFDLTHPDDRKIVQKKINARLKGSVRMSEYEIRALKKNGETFPIRVLGSVATYRGKPAIIGTLLDLSEEKALELQLIRAQKMESLGQLAGGVAHDFNNVLGIIMGSLDLVQNADMSDRSKKLFDMSIQAAKRGAEIVKRLLLFARAEETSLVPVSLPTIIDETIGILEHTLDKNITIQKSVDDSSDVILGNKEQLIQMILNICTNARDAMPSRGSLSIDLEKKTDWHPDGYFSEVGEQNYYALHISDTGIGMDERTKEHIFDPFFTTKERGKGTGLGLSIVHSIVKNHKGFIDVTSTPGQGTTFSIYLPIVSSPILTTESSRKENEEAGGNETILVVDDEEPLRELLQELLVPLGYKVIEAVDGFEAITIFNERARSIDLIILDIGLPGMPGDQVLLKMREIDPETRVVIASGYLEAPRRLELERLGVETFIQKPYTIKELTSAIRKTLDAAAPSPIPSR